MTRASTLAVLLVFSSCALSQAADAPELFRRLHGLTSAESASELPPLGWWYGFRNSHQNRGVSAVAVRDFEGTRGRKPWAVATRGLIWGTPVVDAEGLVYVGSADKRFYCVDPAGSVKWSYTLPDAGDSLVDSAATLTPNGLVVVPGGDGNLHALERATGRLVWRFAAHHAGDHEGGVVVNSFEGNATLGPDGNLYAGSDNGHFYSVDLQGRERWSFKTGMMIWSAAAFDPAGKWLAFGSLDRRVYVLECATGRLIASYKCGGDVKASPAIDDAGRIYVGCSDFSFRCLELGKDFWGRPSLREIWSFPTGGEIYSSAALAGDRLVFGSHDGYLYCLSKQGKLVWKYGVYTRINASPLVSRDGVVFAGAKNGKLYALDIASGKRLWSFKTAPGAKKVNLDSSPALGPDGRVFVGSYDGNLYGVPVEFARQNPQDARCDLRPGDDSPDFDSGVPADGATVRYVDAAGNYQANVPGALGPEAMLSFRLVAREKGVLVPNGALAATGLSVSVEPPTPVDAVVSSDSYYLNVTPRTFWKPGVRYRMTVRGRWFRRRNPFIDLLKWWNLPPVEATVSFTVTEDAGQFPEAAPGESLKYSIRGMYMSQPEILDVLVPAAVEGQAFITSVIARNAERRSLGMLVLPAFPRPEGVVLRPAPDKVFAVNGSNLGESVRLEGSFRMAAMGGDIPFEPIRFFGRLTDDGLADGRLHATAPVLGIKGNGSSNTGLSWSAIDDMSDSWMRLQAVGTLEGDRLASVPAAVTIAGVRWLDGTRLETTVRAADPLAGEHLITAACVDPAAGAIVRFSAAKLGPLSEGATATLVFTGLDRRAAARAPLVYHLDGEPLRLESR